MAELEDAQDLGSCVERRVSSTLTGTTNIGEVAEWPNAADCKSAVSDLR